MGEGILVRDECACGRRYRVKNPTAGFKFQCPNCQREIEITQADILLAEPLEPDLAPTAQASAPDEPEEILDVIPLDDAELRVANHGSRIGALHKIGFSSADAQLRAALSPRSLLNTTDDDELSRFRPVPEKQRITRPFLAEVFMSFALAGSTENALKLTAMTIAISTLFVLGFLFLELMAGNLFLMFVVIVVLFFPALFAMAYLVQFYWEVLGETASGEDELGWEQSAWDVWGDMVKPVFWLLFITGLCALPAMAFMVFSGLPSPGRDYAVYGLLAIGFYFWPVAVMWVAVGESLSYLRPDLLVRSVWVIGPAYNVVWVILLAKIGLWMLIVSLVLTFGAAGPLASLIRVFSPLIGCSINIYLGYVMFRTIGLIFRYHRQKLPLGF